MRQEAGKSPALTPYPVYRAAVKENRDRLRTGQERDGEAFRIGKGARWSGSIRYAGERRLFLLAFVGLVVIVLLVLLQLTRLGFLIRATIPDRPRQRMFIASVSFLITFAGVRILVHRIVNHEGHLQWVVVRGMHIHHLVWGILILLLVGYGWLLDLGWSNSPMSIFFGRLMAVGYGVGAALTLDEFALWLSMEPDAYWTRSGPAEHRRGDPIRRSAGGGSVGRAVFRRAQADVGQARAGAQGLRTAQLADSPRAVASSA